VDISEYTYDGSGDTEMYFKVALVIPNMVDEFYGESNTHATYGPSIVYEENQVKPLHPYSWPVGFAYPIDFYYSDPVEDPEELQTTGTFDLNYIYADDASYAVAKAGFAKHSFIKPGTTGYNFISTAFDGGSTYDIDDLGVDLGLASGETISEWDEVTQDWLTDTWDGSTFNDGGYNTTYNASTAYYVTVNGDHFGYVMGAIPESPVYNLITTALTDLNFVTIPLDYTDITTAATLGAAIGHNNALMISQWDATNQSWNSCVYLNTFEAWINSFDIVPGMPIVIGAEQNFTWPQ